MVVLAKDVIHKSERPIALGRVRNVDDESQTRPFSHSTNAAPDTIPRWRILLGQLTARKPLLQTQAELMARVEFRRTLSALDLVLLGIGCIIGSGIFVLTGVAAAENAGPSVILSFLFAGAAAGFAGLCYAELSTMIPSSGSAYSFTYATLGEFMAWIIGWDLLLEYLVGTSAVAVGWSAYLDSFFRSAFGVQLDKRFCSAPWVWEGGQVTHSGSYINLPAIGISLFLTMLLVVGVRESTNFNNCMVAMKLVAVVVVISVGSFHIKEENFSPFIPPNQGRYGAFGLSGTLQASSMVFFAYIGFDACTTMAQESTNPQRDLPIGILGSLAVCTVLYMLMAFVTVGVVKYTEYKSVANPMAFLVERMDMPWLSIMVSAAALCGISTVILVSLMGQPRVFYSMAEDGLLPPIVATIHPRFKTPYITTIISGSSCALLSGLLPIDILAEMTSIGTLFAFMLCSIGVVVLRYTSPDIPRQFKVWTPHVKGRGLHVVPCLSIACCCLLITSSTSATLVRFVAWLGLGFLVYFLYGMRHSKLGGVYDDISSKELNEDDSSRNEVELCEGFGDEHIDRM